jgi:hypothetical protein
MIKFLILSFLILNLNANPLDNLIKNYLNGIKKERTGGYVKNNNNNNNDLLITDKKYRENLTYIFNTKFWNKILNKNNYIILNIYEKNNSNLRINYTIPSFLKINGRYEKKIYNRNLNLNIKIPKETIQYLIIKNNNKIKLYLKDKKINNFSDKYHKLILKSFKKRWEEYYIKQLS